MRRAGRAGLLGWGMDLLRRGADPLGRGMDLLRVGLSGLPGQKAGLAGKCPKPSSLLIQEVGNQTDGTTQDEETVENTDGEILLSLFSRE